jgi:sugar lactone lactonase YvrE
MLQMSRVRWMAAACAALALGIAAYLLFWPAWVDPVAWTPSPDPGWTGRFARDSAPSPTDFATVEVGRGPEDVAMGPDGMLYTGLADGRIVRFARDGGGATEVAQTGGRPLGLQFDHADELIVADAERGLLRVGRDGTVQLLTNRAAGVPVGFADDLDVAAGGTILFSDMSTRFPNDLHMDYWEGRASGRLLSYNPATGVTAVVADSLRYPNGVAIGPGERYVLVCEMIDARIERIWLRGPRAGTRDVFAAGFPAYLDNISYDGAGTFWVALVGSRRTDFERFAQHPFLRRVMTRVPHLAIPHPFPWLRSGRVDGCVAAVDTSGAVVATRCDASGHYGAMTSANVYGGTLFVGSISMTAVARISLPHKRVAAPGGE